MRVVLSVTLAGWMLVMCAASSAIADDLKQHRFEAERLIWQSIEMDRSARAYEAYLKEFPDGLFRESEKF
jgi:hypothetical protein